MLSLDHAWKRYVLGERGGLLSALGHRARRELWSLRDVSLHVGPGESVGLIGHNGAGKTTTLKLLAGITRPTRGRVAVQGRVASLINLGAGFHRELTGRENVFLNGVLLGLTRQEVRERFDEIVDFADIGEYIDTPVKQYSSGMYARLGFAVAVHVDPDVLLVDEVLSVGDVGFQDRSVRKMLSFRERGCAVLFVSHNLSAVEMMCQRVLWLDHGRVRMEGPTANVVDSYLDAVDHELVDDLVDEAGVLEAGGVRLEGVSIHRADGQLTSELDFGEPFMVRLRCRVRDGVRGLRCTVTVRGDYSPLFAATTSVDWLPGATTLECQFADLPVLPGLYHVDVALQAPGGPPPMPRTVAAFQVETDLARFGSTSVVGKTKSRGGFLAVPYHWELQSVDGLVELAGIHRPL